MTNIYLFHGEDSYSSTAKINFWRREFIKKHEEINLEIIEGEKLDPKNFESNLETMPFLGEKRMIIVRNFLSLKKSEKTTEKQKHLAKHLEKIPDFCILIFQEQKDVDKRTSLYKKITQLGKVETFPTLTLNALTKWVLDQSKSRKISINYATSNYLSQHLGLNLWNISNELDKLEIFANGKEITEDMINKIVPPSLSTSIFKLTDAVAQRQLKESLKTFKALIDSQEDIIRIFFMLVRHFRLLIQTQDMLGKGEPTHSIQKSLKIHPFVMQNMQKQSKSFNLQQLERIYDHLLQIDAGTKTGKIKMTTSNTKEMQLAIEKFIIGCCQN